MIIGVLGQQGAGKDTVSDYLVNNYDFEKVALATPVKEIVKDLFGFTHKQVSGSQKDKNKEDPRFSRKNPTHVEEWNKVLYNVKHQGIFVCQSILDRLSKKVSHEDLYSSLVKWADDFYKESRKGGEGVSPRRALQSFGTDWGRKAYRDMWVDLLWSSYESSLESQDIVISDLRFLNELESIRTKGGHLIKVSRKSKESWLGVLNHISEQEQTHIPESMFNFVICNDGSYNELYNKVDDYMRLWK